MSIFDTTVKVESVRKVSPSIKDFTLSPVSGELYPFSPGSHIVVEIPSSEKLIKNAYSLLSDPWDTRNYKIAVLLQQQSRGGSEYMHENVMVGDELKIAPPANFFAPDWRATKHILIAGGVGITPFMSYLPELIRREADFELHYMFRSEFTGAYKDYLAQYLGEHYFQYDTSNDSRCDISSIFLSRHTGTHFYVCGPESLINSVYEIANASGIPASVIHSEQFSAPKPGDPFEVEIKSTGQLIVVEAEQSMLEAMEAAEIDVPNLCRGGVCGQCRCQVIAGDIEHRDSYLSGMEKESGSAVMPCVSRASSQKIILDL
jgi:ferredoxin-NADP reductase